jgi:hypothetical protein
MELKFVNTVIREMTTMVCPCKRNGISKPPRTNWTNQVLEGMMQDLAKNSKEKTVERQKKLETFHSLKFSFIKNCHISTMLCILQMILFTQTQIHSKLYSLYTTNYFIYKEHKFTSDSKQYALQIQYNLIIMLMLLSMRY